MAWHLVNISTFEPLTSYHQDDYTWCVARAKVIPEWKNVFYIISDDIVFVGLTIAAVSINICIFLLTAFDPRPLDLWESICFFGRTLFGINANYTPQNQKLRCLFVLFIMICLWITTIFIAFIIKFYSLQIYEKQLKSVTEIVERNYKLLTSRALLDRIIQQRMV